jgi:hypothetical protein
LFFVFQRFLPVSWTHVVVVSWASVTLRELMERWLAAALGSLIY